MALEKILLTDDLFTGTPKINAAIDAADKAEKEAASVLGIANSAKQNAVDASNVANDAYVIATNADEKSASTQLQLDTLVIESGTSDAETIQARGGKALLNDRLNAIDTEIVKKDKQLTANHTGTNGIVRNVLSAIDQESITDNISLPFVDNPAPVSVMASGVGAVTFFPAVTTINGSLYTAIRIGTDHATSTDGKIVTRKSTDGITWTYVGQPVNNGRDARDVNLIVAPNGNLIMRFFDRSAANDYIVKVIISTDFGVNWGSEIILPKPSDYTDAVAARGNMAIKDGVIYSINYTITGYAYVVKSADNGASWTYVNYITKDWKLNETSISYNADNNKLYFVGRQQVYKTGVLPYTDYKNFMVIGESIDGSTWTNIRELPLYGHAPSLISLNSKKMLLTFKNTNTDNSTNNFQLNSVVLKNGELFSQVMTLANSPNFDAFYADATILNSKIHYVYHDLNASATRSLSLLFNDVDKLTHLSHVHKPVSSNLTNGFLEIAPPFNLIWQEEAMPAITLNAGAIYNKRTTLHKSFTTRPYDVNAYLYRGAGDLADIDNIIVYARLLNATNVSITFHNIGATNIIIDANYKLKICALGG